LLGIEKIAVFNVPFQSYILQTLDLVEVPIKSVLVQWLEQWFLIFWLNFVFFLNFTPNFFTIFAKSRPFYNWKLHWRFKI